MSPLGFIASGLWWAARSPKAKKTLTKIAMQVVKHVGEVVVSITAITNGFPQVIDKFLPIKEKAPAVQPGFQVARMISNAVLQTTCGALNVLAGYMLHEHIMEDQKTVKGTRTIGALVAGSLLCGVAVLGVLITAVCFVVGFAIGYAIHWWSS